MPPPSSGCRQQLWMKAQHADSSPAEGELKRVGTDAQTTGLAADAFPWRLGDECIGIHHSIPSIFVYFKCAHNAALHDNLTGALL